MTTRRVFLAAGALVPLGAVAACSPAASGIAVVPRLGAAPDAGAGEGTVADAAGTGAGGDDPIGAVRAARVPNDVEPASVFRVLIAPA
jgi:hypothetical protein